jgi:methyl-accepting chemotaxis protein
MSSPFNYSKSDAGMQQLIASLEQHVSAMIQAGHTAEQINQEVGAGYIADSSRVFQQKVQNWVDSYHTVMQKFQKLADDSTQVNQVMNTAEADAGAAGGGWGASDGVFAALAH